MPQQLLDLIQMNIYGTISFVNASIAFIDRSNVQLHLAVNFPDTFSLKVTKDR
jgi:hypothetical protein